MFYLISVRPFAPFTLSLSTSIRHTLPPFSPLAPAEPTKPVEPYRTIKNFYSHRVLVFKEIQSEKLQVSGGLTFGPCRPGYPGNPGTPSLPYTHTLCKLYIYILKMRETCWFMETNVNLFSSQSRGSSFSSRSGFSLWSLWSIFSP